MFSLAVGVGGSWNDWDTHLTFSLRSRGLPPSRMALLAALVLGCQGRERAAEAVVDTSPVRAAQRPSSSERPAVVVLGTSLTAGLGLDPDQAYPALLQRKVDSVGLPFRVVN